MERDASNAENQQKDNKAKNDTTAQRSREEQKTGSGSQVAMVSKPVPSKSVAPKSVAPKTSASQPMNGGVDQLVKAGSQSIEAPLSKEIQTAAKNAYEKRLAAQNEKIGGQIGALQQQIKRLKSTIEVIERRFSSAKRLNKDQYQQLQEQLDTLGQQLSQTHQISAGTQERMNTLIPEYDNQQKEQAQKFVALNNAHQKVVKRIENQLQVWTREIDQQMASLQQALDRCEDQTAGVDKLNACMQGLQSELSEALQAIQSQKDDNKKAHESIQKAVSKQNQDLENMRTVLGHEVRQARAVHQELTQMLAVFSEKQKAAFQDYETLRRALKSDRLALNQDRSTVEQLREQLSDLLDATQQAQHLATEHRHACEAQLEQAQKVSVFQERVMQGADAQVASTEHEEFLPAHTAEQKDIFNRFEKEIDALSDIKTQLSGLQTEVERVSTQRFDQDSALDTLSDKTLELGARLKEGLTRLQANTEQQQALENLVKVFAQRVDQGLSELENGLKKIDDVSNQCGNLSDDVSKLQAHWAQWRTHWNGQWQEMHSANDEQYKNLSALLARSQDNEAHLEKLLESVKSLESRSEYLLESAQTQRQKQHDFAQRIQSDHAKVTQLQENSTDILQKAQQAAQMADQASKSADHVLKVVQGAQAELLVEQEDAVDKATALQEWMSNALKQAQAIQGQTQSLSERQQALEKQCRELLVKGQGHSDEMFALRTELQSIHQEVQSRLDKTRQIESTAQSALANAHKLFDTVRDERKKLQEFHDKAANDLTQKSKDTQALITQAKALQETVTAQSEDQHKAHQNLEALRDQVQSQAQTTQSALDKTQSLHDAWSSHQNTMATLEQRTEDALSANSALHDSAKTLLTNASDEQEQLQLLLQQAKEMTQTVAQSLEKEHLLKSETEKLQHWISDQAQKQEAVAQDQASVVLRTEVMHDQITEMEQKHQANVSAMEDLHKRASTLLKENIDLQSEIRQGHSQLTQMMERVDDTLDQTTHLHQGASEQLEACQIRCDQMDKVLPKLQHELARFDQMGADYAQWDARLKNQSMSLKDAEQKLKAQCRALDTGLSQVEQAQEQAKTLGLEFGNVKKVVAQLMQKFKGMEQNADSFGKRCDALANTQIEQNKRLDVMSQKVDKATRNQPDEAALNTAIEHVKLQSQVNDSVMDKIDALAKRYTNMQEQLHLLHTMPASISDIDKRLKALEMQVQQQAADRDNAPSYAPTQDEFAQLGGRVHQQENVLGSVKDQVQALRREFSDLAKTMQPQSSRNNQSQVVAQPLASAESEQQAVQAPTEQRKFFDSDSTTDTKKTVQPETELDKLSAQLERLSQEAQSWEEPDGQAKGRRVKQFLFSLLALVSVMSSAVWTSQEHALVPTFAYEQFSLNLIHPDQKFDGPKFTADATPVIRSNQSVHTVLLQGHERQLQWPVPGQRWHAPVNPTLASHAVQIPAHAHMPVTAVDDGRVLFSGMSEGVFGQVVIVAHAGDLVSVYGYLNETRVNSGAQVLQGQVIAQLGELNPQLYFELRFEGQSVPPEVLFPHANDSLTSFARMV